MKSSNKFFALAALASLALHAALLGLGPGEETSSKKSVSSARSVLRIDMIRVQPKSAQNKAKAKGPQREAPKRKAIKEAIKGEKAARRNEYLEYVRREIVSRKEFPYAAEKLGLSARYRLLVKIDANGNFSYEASSQDKHPYFDRAIEELFDEIGSFRPPHELAGGGLVIEFDLEFKR